MLLLNKYKWYVFGAAFLAYTAGTWNVASVYNEREWVTKELTRADALVSQQEQNLLLSRQLTTVLQDKLALQQKLAEASQQTIVNEIHQNPIYNDCVVTDSVRGALQRQLDGQ